MFNTFPCLDRPLNSVHPITLLNVVCQTSNHLHVGSPALLAPSIRPGGGGSCSRSGSAIFLNEAAAAVADDNHPPRPEHFPPHNRPIRTLDRLYETPPYGNPDDKSTTVVKLSMDIISRLFLLQFFLCPNSIGFMTDFNRIGSRFQVCSAINQTIVVIILLWITVESL